MDFDIIIAGGSVAGASFGHAAAKAGHRVCIVERSVQFADRVRGEAILPWGVVEARHLGLEDVIGGAPGCAIQYWNTYLGGMQVEHRDLPQTVESGCGGINVHHPRLQDALLAATQAAGATVVRGASVESFEYGSAVQTTWLQGGRARQVRSKLLVIADGRNSRLRAAGGQPLSLGTSPMAVSGVLFTCPSLGPAAIEAFYPPQLGELVLLVPLPAQRTRVYWVCPPDAVRSVRQAPAELISQLLQRCAALGVPPSWHTVAADNARGPCTSLVTAYRKAQTLLPAPGVVLIGDAAGNVDPTFGCGLSLALRDARCLRDNIEQHGPSARALQHYAQERERYYDALVRTEQILHRALFAPEPSPVFAARVPASGVDLVGRGPESPCGVDTERFIFEQSPAL